MNSNRRYSGNPYQIPVKLRTNVPRQTQDDYPPDDDNEVVWEQPKPHTSAVRYDRPKPPPVGRTALLPEHQKTKRMRRRSIDKWTVITWLCLAFIVMVLGWWALSSLVSWWTSWLDDLHYGNPRTFQTDQFTGQGDSPSTPDHFIAVNIHGRVVVVQMNLQHPELDQIYGITTTDPKTPVSLTFRELSNNTLAMYVLVGTDNPYTVELVSNGTKFVSPH